MVSRSSGFTLFEVVAALALAAIMMGIAGANLKGYDRPAQDAASELTGFFKIARGKAIASTAAYRIQPVGNKRVIAMFGKNCSDNAMLGDSKLILDIKHGAELTDTTWSICFNSRGLPDTNATVSIEDNNQEERQVEVMLGGAVRML